MRQSQTLPWPGYPDVPPRPSKSRIDRLDKELALAAAEVAFKQAGFLEDAAHTLYMNARPAHASLYRRQWRAAVSRKLECQLALNDALKALS